MPKRKAKRKVTPRQKRVTKAAANTVAHTDTAAAVTAAVKVPKGMDYMPNGIRHFVDVTSRGKPCVLMPDNSKAAFIAAICSVGRGATCATVRKLCLAHGRDPSNLMLGQDVPNDGGLKNTWDWLASNAHIAQQFGCVVFFKAGKSGRVDPGTVFKTVFRDKALTAMWVAKGKAIAADAGVKLA
jgi:hypothetical protein